MASYILTGPRKRRRRKSARPIEEYIAAAQRLSELVPGLKKYKRRKTLKRSEKSSIARRENQLKNIPYLFPVTKKQAKRLKKGKMFLPGVRAIQLRNVPEHAKIRIGKHGDINIFYHEGEQARRWIYWSLDRETVRSKRGMRGAGADAFSKMFPIEIITEMAADAFRRTDVSEVRLWAHAGIVGDSFGDLPSFVRWVNEKWSNGRYMGTQDRVGGDIYSNPSDPGRWVNGLAILLEDAEYAAKRKALHKPWYVYLKGLIVAGPFADIQKAYDWVIANGGVQKGYVVKQG